MSKQLKKAKLIAIKGFNEELYRLVKTYASLEGRTVASIFEEALQLWMESRTDLEEVRLWVNLERNYRENFEALRKVPSDRRGYALISDGNLIGIFNSYEEAVKKSRKSCKAQALIVKLPFEEEVKRIELGLPW